MPTPDWLDLAKQGDLTPQALENDAADLRLDTAFSNLQAAMTNAVAALDRHGYPELATQLCENLVSALKGKSS